MRSKTCEYDKSQSLCFSAFKSPFLDFFDCQNQASSDKHDVIMTGFSVRIRPQMNNNVYCTLLQMNFGPLFSTTLLQLSGIFERL